MSGLTSLVNCLIQIDTVSSYAIDWVDKDRMLKCIRIMYYAHITIMYMYWVINDHFTVEFRSPPIYRVPPFTVPFPFPPRGPVNGGITV